MHSKKIKVVPLYEDKDREVREETKATSHDDESGVCTRDILSRIKQELGLDTDIELADAMGVGVRRIHNWKHRNTIPTEEIVAVCGKEGLDLHYILTGPGNAPTPAQVSKTDLNFCGVPENQTQHRDTYIPSKCGQPRIHPPYKAYTQRSESGAIITSFKSPQIVDVLAPGSNWLTHSLGIAPEYFLLIKILGDNMSPWVQDGDLVIVDTSIKTTTAGGCLLLRYPDGMLMVRRAYRDQQGRLMVKDDNECSPPDSIDPNDNTTYPIIVGRVVRRLVR